MKPKPRVRKDGEGWKVERPGYGFGQPTTDGPYPSREAAFAALRGTTASAGPIIERTTTPSGVRRGWPLEVR